METGLLYVVFNKWICDPETKEMPYKIGITRNTVYDRYYGLGLKMPGKFETLFAYRLRDYAKAEQAIQSILNNKCVNGEWFNLNEGHINLIKNICETMDGELITEEIENEIEAETEESIKIDDNLESYMGGKLVENELLTGNNANEKVSNFQNNNRSINPNHPCKVFLFPIGNAFSENNNAYEATRKWWRISDEYSDTSKYEFAVGLVKGISVGSYKLNRWIYNQDYKKSKFDADEYPDFIGYSWHKQIQLAQGYYGYGNHLVIEFDGNGKFKILRGSNDNKEIWFNC